MSVNSSAQVPMDLEERILDTLRGVMSGPDGPDIVSSGQVFAVVATGGAVRVLLDPEQIPENSEEALAEAITPLVEALPGVERAVVKPRPRSIAMRDSLPGIRRVVGVHSGKGGVGKSTVAVNLAAALAHQGFKVGLLDADVYGPSGPTLLGLSGRAQLSENGTHIQPFEAHGVKLMSLGFLMPEGQALAWRGSLIDEGLPQLFTDVDWGELDLLLVDLPPGTSDVHLAVARQVRIDGVITVTAPGQVSLDDVRRGMEMFADLAVPCLGLVENMAGVTCRHCGHVGPVFGEDGGALLAEETGLPLLMRMPFVPEVAMGSDIGKPIAVDQPDSAPGQAFAELAIRVAGSLRLKSDSCAGSGKEEIS